MNRQAAPVPIRWITPVDGKEVVVSAAWFWQLRETAKAHGQYADEVCRTRYLTGLVEEVTKILNHVEEVGQ